MLKNYFERIKKLNLKGELDFEILTVHEYPVRLYLSLFFTFLVCGALLVFSIAYSSLFPSTTAFWISILCICLLCIIICCLLVNKWFCTFHTVTLDTIYTIRHRHIFATGGGEESLSLLHEVIGAPEFKGRYLSFLDCGIVRIHTKHTDIVTGNPIVKKIGIVPKRFHVAVLEAMNVSKLLGSGPQSREERSMRAHEIRERQNKSKERIALIKMLVSPYRKHNPLPISVLLKRFNHDFREHYSEAYFVKAVHEWQAIGELSNIGIEGGNIFLEKENISDKQLHNITMKKKIAGKAVEFIRSGDIVAIDPGSTNLEIAKRICQEIPQKFSDITIVTNSIPVVNELMNWLRERKSREGLLRVYMIEGRALPDSLAITHDDFMKIESMTGFTSLLERLSKQQADIAFIGTSGLCGDEGLAVDTDNEIGTKHDIWRSSKKRVIVMDASKFKPTESRSFIRFTDAAGDMTILTCYEKEYEDQLESFNNLIKDKQHIQLMFA